MTVKLAAAAALALSLLGCSAGDPEPTPTPAPGAKCVYLAGYYYVGKVMIPYYRPCPDAS
jgi:hypothetical protein